MGSGELGIGNWELGIDRLKRNIFIIFISTTLYPYSLLPTPHFSLPNARISLN
jgi:hypothetical protein